MTDGRQRAQEYSPQYLGPARNILMPGPEQCQMLELDHPVINNDVLEQLRHSDIQGFRGTTLSTLFDATQGHEALEQRLHALFVEAEAAVAPKPQNPSLKKN